MKLMLVGKIIKVKKNNTNKKKESLFAEFNDNYFVYLLHILYKYFGRKFLMNKKFSTFFYKSIYNKKYDTILKKANLKLLPEEYFVSIYMIIVTVVVSLIITSLVFLFIDPVVSVVTFYGGIIFVSFMGIFMYNYPIVIYKTRGTEIDASLPYLLPYMKILAKEINLSKIIGIIDEFLIYKEIRVEFRKIKYYSEFLGYDIHSSIREAMVSCPSRQLSDLMNDLVTISNSGGDIYGYLERKLSNLDQEILAIEKKNIDTLLIFSQIYVVLLLISPLFFTIMSTILNLISFSTENVGADSGSGTAGNIIMLLIILPFCYVGFMFLVYYSKPLYARLNPVEK